MSQTISRGRLTSLLLAISSFIVPGVGHLFGGKLGKAFGLLTLVGLVSIINFILGAFFASVWILAGTITMVIYVYLVVDAYKINREGVTLRWYNTWYFYIIFTVFLCLVTSAPISFDNTYKYYRIADTHNSPTLEVGDYIRAKVFDNNPQNFSINVNYPIQTLPMIRVGRYILYKIDGDKTYIDKVVAIGPDTYIDSDVKYIVPADTVLVQSQGRYLTVPVKAIIGRAVDIYWSNNISKIGSRVKS